MAASGHIAVIGAGWAGLAAAIGAVDAGWRVTVFEASRSLGGRARALDASAPDGSRLDNGQHILIGAYTDTLGLMRRIGLDPAQLLLELPLSLQFPDRSGLRLPDWPAPLDALAGVALARGWRVSDKLDLIRHLLRWRRQGFVADPQHSVADLCARLSARIRDDLIEPLCVSALNTPAADASASVFLRVLHDALMGPPGASRLLLPRTDLGCLFPEAAGGWLQQRSAQLRLGRRVTQIAPAGTRWQADGEPFDALVLACPAAQAAPLLRGAAASADADGASAAVAPALRAWAAIAENLRFEAIATVYAQAPQARLAQPMLALRSSAQAPAQFAFDRGQLGGPAGLLAFVVSASQGDRATLQAQVLAQAQAQLGLRLQPVRTLIEKRATFACTPGLQRPPGVLARGLLACGDHVAGPYPATLEGAVRSGLAAADMLKAL